MKKHFHLRLFLMLLFGVAFVAFAEEQVAIEARVKPVLEVDGLQFKDLNGNGALDPYEDWRLSIDERVDNLVSLMTIEEKAGQMVHPNLEVPLDGSCCY